MAMAEGGERREDAGQVVEPKKQGRTDRGGGGERPLGFSQRALTVDLVRGLGGVARTKPGAEERGKTLLFLVPGAGLSLLEEG